MIPVDDESLFVSYLFLFFLSMSVRFECGAIGSFEECPRVSWLKTFLQLQTFPGEYRGESRRRIRFFLALAPQGTRIVS